MLSSLEVSLSRPLAFAFVFLTTYCIVNPTLQVVLVVDQFGGKGNVLNFNVGDGVKFALPNVFWTRLQGKYGTVRFKIYIDVMSFWSLHSLVLLLF